MTLRGLLQVSLVYRSRAVVCTLQRAITRNGYDEVDERRIQSISDCAAFHDETLCQMEEPCVIICKGTNSLNIISLLVHESIHHSLLWLHDELPADDRFDNICPTLAHQREIGI
jgi:hypothetical protein